MTYFTREEWGARPPRTGGNAVTNGPKGVAVHYNGPPLYIGQECHCDIVVRIIQNNHMDKQGWKDIAYDVVGCPHGNTYQGRFGTKNGTGANGTREANEDYMAVMGLIGEGEEPTPALYVAIRDGIKMCQDAGAGEEITGHGAFVNTPCPGPLWPWVRAGAPVSENGEEVVTEITKLVTMLAYGSRGAEVTLLQNMLNGLIGAGIPVDGSFGPATENKVKEFQASYGFDVDGLVGPITRRQLNSDWAEFNAPATPEPEPTPEPPVETGGMPILGLPAAPVEAYREAASKTRANALFLDEMLPALYAVAVEYSIDPAVMIGQSGHETGWGHFGRAVTPEHHNTCGLKVRNPVGPDTNPDDHATFDSWEEGATAHAQHLYAYMGTALPEGVENVDPRWDWVFGKHKATVVEDLSGKWAPAGTYGDSVVKAANIFADVSGFVPAEPPVEEPVEPPVEPEEPVIDEPTPEPEPPVVDEPDDPVVDFPSEEPTVADLTLVEFFEILDEHLDEDAIADRVIERIVQKLTA